MSEDLETIEHRGFADMFRAAPAALAAERGIALDDRDGVITSAIAASPGSIMFNHCSGLGAATPATEADVDDRIAFFDRHGAGGAFAVSPGARPPELVAWLEARGFAPGYAWAKFRRRAGDAPTDVAEHRIERIGADAAGDFATVVCEGFGLPDWFADWMAAVPGRPGWHCYVGYVDGEPAASGAVFVDGDVGWVGFGATRSTFRRRGLQRAMLAHRIAVAPSLGCATLVTETGERDDGVREPSYRNILWSGFERSYRRPNYVRKR